MGIEIVFMGFTDPAMNGSKVCKTVSEVERHFSEKLGLHIEVYESPRKRAHGRYILGNLEKKMTEKGHTVMANRGGINYWIALSGSDTVKTAQDFFKASESIFFRVYSPGSKNQASPDTTFEKLVAKAARKESAKASGAKRGVKRKA